MATEEVTKVVAYVERTLENGATHFNLEFHTWSGDVVYTQILPLFLLEQTLAPILAAGLDHGVYYTRKQEVRLSMSAEEIAAQQCTHCGGRYTADSVEEAILAIFGSPEDVDEDFLVMNYGLCPNCWPEYN